jgi:hypothetical protein
MVNATWMAARKRYEIESLLPWHATGTLSHSDSERVEQALAEDAGHGSFLHAASIALLWGVAPDLAIERSNLHQIHRLAGYVRRRDQRIAI